MPPDELLTKTAKYTPNNHTLKSAYQIPPDFDHCFDHCNNVFSDVARDIGIKRIYGRMSWPYGPNINLHSREAMINWAYANQLKLSQNHKSCIQWLKKGRCVWHPGCGGLAGDGNYSKSSRDFGARRIKKPHIEDHLTCWLRGGKPAVLVAQPYANRKMAVNELRELPAWYDNQIEIELSDVGWYRESAFFVAFWAQPIFVNIGDVVTPGIWS